MRPFLMHDSEVDLIRQLRALPPAERAFLEQTIATLADDAAADSAAVSAPLLRLVEA